MARRQIESLPLELRMSQHSTIPRVGPTIELTAVLQIDDHLVYQETVVNPSKCFDFTSCTRGQSLCLS